MGERGAVLSFAVSALSNRLDSKFLTAFWLPAFVAILGSIGILTVLVGSPRLALWIADLGSVGQSLGALILLLLITMLACVLRALTWAIAAIFAGDVLPQPMAAWSTRGQLRAQTRAIQALRTTPNAATLAAIRTAGHAATQSGLSWEPADLMPTLFGNVLATASEHPRVVYAMEGAFWWPRLAPLLPGAFQEMLGSAQAPMMGLLNLSFVFAVLALGGALTLGVVGALWTTAGIVLIGGLVLSRLCYRAAIGQAVGLGSQLDVAFDLYRHEILRQMGLETPADLPAERALWSQLAIQLQRGAEPVGVPEAPRPAP